MYGLGLMMMVRGTPRAREEIVVVVAMRGTTNGHDSPRMIVGDS